MRKFEVRPRRPIPNILPNHKRIEEPMILPLSRNEFLRCMQFGDVYAIVGDEKILVTTTDYTKVMEMFGSESPKYSSIEEFAKEKSKEIDNILEGKRINLKDSASIRDSNLVVTGTYDIETNHILSEVKSNPQPAKEETPTEPLPVKVVSSNHRSTVVEDKKEEQPKEEKNKSNVYSSKNYSKRNKK